MVAMKVLMVCFCLMDMGLALGDIQFPFWWRPRPATNPTPKNLCPGGADLNDPCTTSKGPGRGLCKTDTSCSGSTCQLVCEDGDPCQALPLTSYGYFVLVDITDVTLGAKANLNCVEGYSSPGATITCQQDGTWTSTDTICQPISCGAPPVDDNGPYVVVGTDGPGVFGSVAFLKCLGSFQIPVGGNGCIQCLASGNWTAPATTCAPPGTGK